MSAYSHRIDSLNDSLQLNDIEVTWSTSVFHSTSSKSIGISVNSVSRNRMPLKTMAVASMLFLRTGRASYSAFFSSYFRVKSEYCCLCQVLSNGNRCLAIGANLLYCVKISAFSRCISQWNFLCNTGSKEWAQITNQANSTTKDKKIHL